MFTSRERPALRKGRGAAFSAGRLGSLRPRGSIFEPGREIKYGLLAQLVEHRVHIAGVIGSSPIQTTKSACLMQALFCAVRMFRPIPQGKAYSIVRRLASLGGSSADAVAFDEGNIAFSNLTLTAALSLIRQLTLTPSPGGRLILSSAAWLPLGEGLFYRLPLGFPWGKLRRRSRF